MLLLFDAKKGWCCLDNEKAGPFINLTFAEHFTVLLASCPIRTHDLCGAAQISDRMFRYIRQGVHLRKGAIVALLISMEQDLHDIQTTLKTAGFVLTRSLPEDLIVMWMLENGELQGTPYNRIISINETLDYFGLPLLTGHF